MILYLAIAVGLLAIAKYSLRGRYTPAHTWAYAWAFAWACQAFFGSQYVLDESTVVFVLIATLAYLVGAGFAKAPKIDATPDKAMSRGDSLRRTSRTLTVISLLSLLAGFVELNSALKSLGQPGLASVFSGSFAQFASTLTATKASLQVDGTFVVPGSLTLSAMFLVNSALLTGIGIALAKGRSGWIQIAPLVGVIGLAFFTSAGTGVRSYLLIAVFMLVSAYLATKVLTNGTDYRVSKVAQGLIAISVAGFMVWVVVVQSARRGDLGFQEVSATLDYLRSWFAGYLPAFSVWSNGTDFNGLGLGSNLFAGLLGPLGLAHGAYQQQVAAVSIGGGATSNAMTIFRVLVLDFGYPGTVLVCAIAGFLFQRVYWRALSGSAVWIVPLTAAYAITLFSFNFWFFAYGSRIAGVVLAAVVVGACQLATRISQASARARTPRPRPQTRPRRSIQRQYN